MTTPFRPLALTTPIEPGAARPPGRSAADARQALHGGALGRFEVAVASDCGSQHPANEDAHSPLEGDGRLFVVADGVGGGAQAALASRQLVGLLHASLAGQRIEPERVQQAMLAADRGIARRIAQLTDLPGAATVALCAPQNLFASRWLVAWVGDCRVYRLVARADADIELLTRDHTFGHLDEMPPPGGAADDPARMVGNGAVSSAGVGHHDLAAGDLLALCSDGVHKHLQPADWTRLLRTPQPLVQRADALIARARANGSVDDATVLLVQRCGLGRGGVHGVVDGVVQ